MSDDGWFISPECIIYERGGKPGTDKHTIVINEERKNACAGQTSIFQRGALKAQSAERH